MKLYYAFQFKKKIGADEEIMNTIPAALRARVMANRYDLVLSCPIFQGCQDNFLSTLSILLK